MNPVDIQNIVVLISELAQEQFQHIRVDGNLVRFDYLAGPIPLACYVEINPELRACLFRAILSPPIEPTARARAIEYMTRVNYELAVGSWTLDLGTGEVRWKSGFFFGDELPKADLLRELMTSSTHLIYRYVFGIVKLIVGGSVAEAMNEIGTDHGIGRFAE